MSSYSEAEVIRKAKALKIWAEIGYTPDLARYDLGYKPSEEVYVDRVLTHFALRAHAYGAAPGLSIAAIMERALCEYCGVDDGVVTMVTRARVRLQGKKPGRQSTWPTANERDVQDTIRALVNLEEQK